MVRLLFIVVFLITLIIFALSNLDETTSKMITMDISMPVGILVMIVGLVSAVFGAAMTSVGSLRQRRRARKAEQQVQTLQSQLVNLHERMSPVTPPDAPARHAGASDNRNIQSVRPF